MEHENDPDINDPLPADAKPPPKKVLTEEEKASKAEELKKRIAENRRILAEQEKENELKRELDRYPKSHYHHREDRSKSWFVVHSPPRRSLNRPSLASIRRIKSGREMADTRRKLQEQERQRAIDLRKKEKAEDIAHREQLRQLLRQDRINRFGIEKANVRRRPTQQTLLFSKSRGALHAPFVVGRDETGRQSREKNTNCSFPPHTPCCCAYNSSSTGAGREGQAES